MKPAALTMNIFVTVLVLARLAPRGNFNWRLFLPFVLASFPMAFVGGALPIHDALYKYLLGFALILASMRLLWQQHDHEPVDTPKPWITAPIGALLGFVAGMTGVGGGIFLSPLLLTFRWTNMRGSVASDRKTSIESPTNAFHSMPRSPRWRNVTICTCNGRDRPASYRRNHSFTPRNAVNAPTSSVIP